MSITKIGFGEQAGVVFLAIEPVQVFLIEIAEGKGDAPMGECGVAARCLTQLHDRSTCAAADCDKKQGNN